MGTTNLDEFKAKKAQEELKREILALIATWVGTIALSYFILVVDVVHDSIGRPLQLVALVFILFFFWRSYFEGKKDMNKDFTFTYVWVFFLALMMWFTHTSIIQNERVQNLLPPGNVEKGIPY